MGPQNPRLRADPADGGVGISDPRKVFHSLDRGDGLWAADAAANKAAEFTSGTDLLAKESPPSGIKTCCPSLSADLRGALSTLHLCNAAPSRASTTTPAPEGVGRAAPQAASKEAKSDGCELFETIRRNLTYFCHNLGVMNRFRHKIQLHGHLIDENYSRRCMSAKNWPAQ
jgi:hypothetical protein